MTKHADKALWVNLELFLLPARANFKLAKYDLNEVLADATQDNRVHKAIVGGVGFGNWQGFF